MRDQGADLIRVGRRMQELDPKESEGFSLAADGLSQGGDAKGALIASRKALDLNPNDSRAAAIAKLSGRHAPGYIKLPSKQELAAVFGDHASGNSPAASSLPMKLPVKVGKTAPVPKWTPPAAERGSPAPVSPLLPLGAGLGLGLAAYGVARSKRTWSPQDQTPTNRERSETTSDQGKWLSAAKSFAVGASVGLASAALIGGTAVLAVSLGAPAIVVTGALGVVAVAGGVLTGLDIYDNLKTRNWNNVAYDAGAVAGGVVFGAAGGGRFIANGVSPTPSSVPRSLNPLGDWAWHYNPNYPGGSLTNWLGSGPTPQSGAGTAALGGAGLSQGIRPAAMRLAR